MRRLYSIIAENPRKFILRPLIFYWALIFTLTTLPGNVIVNSIKLSDKVEHILAYFGLAFLLMFFFRFFKSHYLILKRLFFTLIIAILYAGFDEIHQLVIPKRQADFLDFIADTLGAVLGIFVAELIIYFGDKNLKHKKNSFEI